MLEFSHFTLTGNLSCGELRTNILTDAVKKDITYTFGSLMQMMHSSAEKTFISSL